MMLRFYASSAFIGITFLLLLGSCFVLYAQLQTNARLEQVNRYAQTSISSNVELSSQLNELRICVIQVQQYLSDISATRGENGLDRGFQQAEEQANIFRNLIASAEITARKLALNDVQIKLANMSATFESYYASGRKMAENYVKEGTAAGNSRMPSFDAKAEQIGHELAAFDQIIKASSVRSRSEILELTSVIAKTTSLYSFFTVVTGVVNTILMIGAVLLFRR